MKKSLILFLLLFSISLSAQDLKIRGVDENGKPLIILQHEGKNYKMTDEVMQSLDPSQIKSINVLKGNSATSLYGKNATNGVIQISLKNSESGEETFTQIKDQLVLTGIYGEFKEAKPDAFLENKVDLDISGTLIDSPLLILQHNGKNYPIERSQLEDMDSEMIKSINVLKGNSATNFYGSGAANGVVLISLKDDQNGRLAFEKIKGELKESASFNTQKTINIESMPKDEMDGIHSEKESAELKGMSPDILYILAYGKEDSKIIRKGIDKINVDLIQGLTVFKDAESKKKLQAVDKEGVIVIQLKETKEAKKLFKKIK